MYTFVYGDFPLRCRLSDHYCNHLLEQFIDKDVFDIFPLFEIIIPCFFSLNRWYRKKDEKLLPITSATIEQLHGVLQFNAPEVHDTGNYVCVVFNEVGETQVTMKLIVRGEFCIRIHIHTHIFPSAKSAFLITDHI